jgi:circadian clock protein KaiB
MKKKTKKRSVRKAPKDSKGHPSKMYALRLYITGRTPRSVASVRNLRKVLDTYLAGRFELEVIDIYQQPELARNAQIIAAPTLVKESPLPVRRLVGDLSNAERVLKGLGLKIPGDKSGKRLLAKGSPSGASPARGAHNLEKA